jgi:hypothetical protein
MSTDPRDIPPGSSSGSGPGSPQPLTLTGLPDALTLLVDAKPMTVPVGPEPGTVLRFSVKGGMPGGEWKPTDIGAKVSSSNLLTSLAVFGPDPVALAGVPVLANMGGSYEVGPVPLEPGDYYVVLKTVPGMGAASGQVEIGVGRPALWERLWDRLPDWIPFVKR